jgi:hypothetical protein
MSVEQMRTRLLALKEEYPKQFLLIRSANEIDKIDIMNSDVSDLFDFGDPRAIQLVESALSAGKQVAVQGAGPDRIMIHTAKNGKKLFR